MISINVAPLQALFNVLYPPFSFSSPNTPSMRMLVSSTVSRVSLRRCPFFSVLCSLWSWEGVTSWSSCRFTDSFCQFTCPVEALIGYCHLFYFFFITKRHALLDCLGLYLRSFLRYTATPSRLVVTCPQAPARRKRSLFSASSPALVIWCSFGYWPSWGAVPSHCGFDVDSPDAWWCRTCFHVPVGHRSIRFGKTPVVLCLVFNWVVYIFRWMSSLYGCILTPYWMCHL